MQLRHRVAINGMELDEIDDRVIVQGVSTNSGKMSITAVSLYGQDGQRVTGSQRDTIDVEVRFGLKIRKTDMLARAALFDTVNAWAALAQKVYGGAWLTVNYKYNRRIHVYLVDPAEEGDLKDWNNTFAITFRAFGVPYWQEVEADSFTSEEGTTDSGTLTVGGSVRTVADVTLSNESADTINTASVTAGNSTMAFSSLGLAAGETLVIDHDDEGRLRLRILNTSNEYRSVYNKRTAESANDLFVLPGTPTVSFTAQRACIMTATAPGRFL